MSYFPFIKYSYEPLNEMTSIWCPSISLKGLNCMYFSSILPSFYIEIDYYLTTIFAVTITYTNPMKHRTLLRLLL